MSCRSSHMPESTQQSTHGTHVRSLTHILNLSRLAVTLTESRHTSCTLLWRAAMNSTTLRASEMRPSSSGLHCCVPRRPSRHSHSSVLAAGLKGPAHVDTDSSN